MTDSGIFYRILSRLEAPQLQRHCSLVFDDELHAIHAQVSQLTAAFARLQEVRDAAASLEQGRTDVTRAPSLLREVDDAAALHQQLSERLLVVQTAVRACSRLEPQSPTKSYKSEKKREELQRAATTDKRQSDAKRKHHEMEPYTKTRVKEEAPRRSSDSESDYEDERPVAEATASKKRPRQSEEHTKKTSSAEPFDNSEWKQKVQEVLKKAQRLSRKKSPAKLAEFDDVSRLARQLLHDLTQQPRERHQELANCPFRNVFASISRGIRSRLETIKAAEFVPLLGKLTHVLDLACHQHPDLATGLKRYADEFSSILLVGYNESEQAKTTSKAESASAPKSDPNDAERLEKLLVKGKEIMLIDAQKRGGRVVDLVNKLMARLTLPPARDGERAAATQWFEVAAELIHLVVTLVCEQKWTPPSGQLYGRLVGKLQTLGKSSSVFDKLTKQSREQLREYLAPPGARREPPTDPKPPRVKDSKVDIELRGQLESAIAEVHSWDAFTLRQFDEVMRVVENVMAHRSKTKGKHEDRKLRECLSLLSRRIGGIKKEEHRETRSEKISEWERRLR